MKYLSTHSTSSVLILNKIEGSRILKKLSKKVILGILAILIIGAPLLYLILLNSKLASAAWPPALRAVGSESLMITGGEKYE